MNMLGFDMATLPKADIHKIIIGAVVPRPIAWVGTVSAEGHFNLAPFSFFTAAGTNPPTLVFCPVNPPRGGEKDTLRNIRATGEFVINIATTALVEQMNQTSADYSSDTSEFDATGLTALPGVKVRAPRVAESPIQMECRLLHIVELGPRDAPGVGHIVAGELLYAHIDSAACDSRNHIDIAKIRPLSRLAGTDYAEIGRIFSLPRPEPVSQKK